MNACVQAYDAAHQNSRPRGAGDVPIVVNQPSLTIQSLASVFAALDFSTALQKILLFFNTFGWKNAERFTAILSKVEIRLPDQTVESRLIVFANRKGLPPELEQLFKDSQIPIVRATASEVHAEVAAADFRNLPGLQKQVLGGELEQVDAAVSTSGACRRVCADALTRFIGDPNVTIEEGGNGFIRAADGRYIVFNPSARAGQRSEFGGKNIVETIVNADAEVSVFDDSGDPIDDPGD